MKTKLIKNSVVSLVVVCAFITMAAAATPPQEGPQGRKLREARGCPDGSANESNFAVNLQKGLMTRKRMAWITRLPPLGANFPTGRLTLPCREVSSVHDMPPEQLSYCFFATPRPTSRPSAAPNCNSLPPSRMTKARVWLEPLLNHCIVPVPSGFTV